MKLLAVAVTLLAVACAVPVSEEQAAHREWSDFKSFHGKAYETEAEEAFRFAVFKKNRNQISEHNARFERGEETYTVAMNQFGDLHHHEFVALMNGYNRTARMGGSFEARKPGQLYKPVGGDIPDSVDWREKGYVTPVKNQGTCGSCWSFSATGSLEGQLFKKNGKLVSLSEQNLVDCSKSYKNDGCNGGLMDQAFQYIKDNKGVDTEESYPYEGMDGKCRFSSDNVGGTDTGYVDIKSGSEDDLKDAVATIGPVSVAIDASQMGFQFYFWGIYNSWFCGNKVTDLDHGVLVVGYGTENGQDYWLVKNSWGPHWGQKGYVKMIRNHKNHCGVATEASYPLV